MKKCIIIFVLLNITCYASDLRVVLKDGNPVIRNISKNSFFFNAFKHSNMKRRKILNIIKHFAKKYGVNFKIAQAIAKIESDYNPKSVSSSGAKGVMQLMDKTAKSYGVKNPFDVDENIRGGILFLKHLISKYHNVKLVAAAYNAGESAVDRYKGVPPFKETQYYVKKFLSIYNGKRMGLHIISGRAGVSRKIVKRGDMYTNIGNSLW